MNYKLLINTLIHLKPTQVVYQVRYRLVKPRFQEFQCSMVPEVSNGSRWAAEPIPRPKCTDGDKFTFINIPSEFTDWNDPSRGMLWAYNQNYFDFINQSPECLKGSSSSKGLNDDKEYGLYWLDKFIAELPQNKVVGLDPYPIALRGINWIKFFGRYPECATKERVDSLWSQYKLLEKKQEYHLLANHLLEDAFSLYIGACYFQGARMMAKAERLLLEQLKEQTLEDGAHYEQSVMYHSILLDRLLDCINLASGSNSSNGSNGLKGLNCLKGEKSNLSNLSNISELKQYASQMLGWLEAMCYEDGTWPFFNDAALGIAPTPKEIFDYAERLGLVWKKTELKDSGYRSLRSKVEGLKSFEAMVDVGNITATYQPGHTHADSLNYELRIDGKPFIVDTGISTYNKTPRRQYERSTIAHNCVVPADNYGTDSSQSSSQVWGGFRVGKRCKVSLIKDSANEVSACHNGFAKSCSRTFRIENDAFIVEDQYDGNAISLIHLAQDADVNRICVEGASKIEVVDENYSVEYNRFLPCKVMKIYFAGKLKYTIR